MIFRYIKLVKKHELEISQPAITSRKVPIYKITMKRNHVEVHKYVSAVYFIIAQYTFTKY